MARWRNRIAILVLIAGTTVGLSQARADDDVSSVAVTTVADQPYPEPSAGGGSESGVLAGVAVLTLTAAMIVNNPGYFLAMSPWIIAESVAATKPGTR